jgi:hypothetical protein
LTWNKFEEGIADGNNPEKTQQSKFIKSTSPVIFKWVNLLVSNRKIKEFG